MSAHFKNRDYVIGVLLRFQIKDERWKTEKAKCGRRKNTAFETRCSALTQNTLRRTRGVTKIIGQLVQKTLHAGRRFQRADSPQFRPA